MSIQRVMRYQQMIKRLFIAVVIISIFWVPSSWAADAVASIKSIQGRVEVERESRILAGRTGLILYDNDLVLTDYHSKVSIIFRDGSIIRLFPKTKFLIEKSQEAKKGSRKFLHRFMLKVGSLWGKFTQNRQQTTIITPTATAGIKGTNVAFSQRNNAFSVSLSEGSVSIKNEDDEVNLEAGQMIRNLHKNGSVQDKVQSLPYQISIDPGRIEFKPANAGSKVDIFFTVQLLDLKTNQNVQKAGIIHLTSDLDKIEFPNPIQLNDRGYARVMAKVSALEPKDMEQNYAEILAVMDEEANLDVGAGRTVLWLDTSGKKPQKIKIDVKSGTLD